jgi:hypothetical protein
MFNLDIGYISETLKKNTEINLVLFSALKILFFEVSPIILISCLISSSKYGIIIFILLICIIVNLFIFLGYKKYMKRQTIKKEDVIVYFLTRIIYIVLGLCLLYIYTGLFTFYGFWCLAPSSIASLINEGFVLSSGGKDKMSIYSLLNPTPGINTGSGPGGGGGGPSNPQGGSSILETNSNRRSNDTYPEENSSLFQSVNKWAINKQNQCEHILDTRSRGVSVADQKQIYFKSVTFGDLNIKHNTDEGVMLKNWALQYKLNSNLNHQSPMIKLCDAITSRSGDSRWNTLTLYSRSDRNMSISSTFLNEMKSGINNKNN